MEETLNIQMNAAKTKAIDSLSRYKFAMFGYWAGIWVHLNHISNQHKPNTFNKLVNLAKDMRATNNGT